MALKSEGFIKRRLLNKSVTFSTALTHYEKWCENGFEEYRP
jgi:hypothetical protein